MAKEEKNLLAVEVLNGVYDGLQLSFATLPITIGRSPDNDVAIPFDTAASRSHAKIVKGESKNILILIDLNSTNGTFVNGLIIRDQAEVKTGDEVKVGDTLIRCVVNPKD